MRLCVQNVDGIPNPHYDPVSIKTEMICATVRSHDIAILLETRTNDLDRLMVHLHDTHKLVCKLDVPQGHAGRGGYGLDVIASRAWAEFMTAYRFAADIQCVWMLCQKELFGMGQ